MGQTGVSLRFATSPFVPRYVPRAVFGRRLASLPAGSTVPRLEGEVTSVPVDRGHLARYRRLCGFEQDDALPVTYPHVLATPLHIALLTRREFIVRLMGLVHVANEIVWRRPLALDGDYSLRAWLEGHRDTDRGQEFVLHTEMLEGGEVCWIERCTLLARMRGAGVARSARAALRAPRPANGEAVTGVPLAADPHTVRLYGVVSGDLNPIHLSDFSARWFGFDRAVAHGMWSMAASLAALGPGPSSRPGRTAVEFKLPVYLPARVRVDHWTDAGGRTFVLRDAATDRPHLAGSVEQA